MPLFRMLLLTFGIYLSHPWLFAQTVEIFVETGVPIAGEPGGRSLDQIRDEAMTINQDGVVIFSARWATGEGNEESFLKATDVNQVSYLIGPRHVLPNGNTISDIDTDELIMNESGDFAFIAESFLDLNSSDPTDMVLLGKYDQEDTDFHRLDLFPDNLYDFSESGLVVYSAQVEDAGKTQLLAGSRLGQTLLLQEDLPIVPESPTVWNSVSHHTAASFMNDAHPTNPDSILFNNGIWTNGSAGGIRAVNFNEGSQTHLYTDSAEAMHIRPYDETRYLLQVVIPGENPNLEAGWYLVEMGSAVTTDNLITPITEELIRPVVAPDGTIYVSNIEGGISKFKPEETPLTSIITPNQADGNRLAVLGLSNSGLLIFVSRFEDDPVSLFSFDTNSETITRFLGPGILVGGNAVTVIGDNQSSDDRTLGRWPLFPIAGNFMATWSNLGIIRVNFGVESPYTHTWTGESGDGKWSTPGNWVDNETGLPPSMAPGDPQGEGPNQTIEIIQATVTVDGSIWIGKIDATGSLIISDSLTVDGELNTENLQIHANLSLKQNLILKGNSNTLHSGRITLLNTDSSIIIEIGKTLTLRSGEIYGGGSILDSRGILNRGTIVKDTAETTVLNSSIDNSETGTIEVNDGTLELGSSNLLDGNIEVKKNALMILTGSANLYGLTVAGEGVLRIEDTLGIRENEQNTFNLVGDNGRVEFLKQAEITGIVNQPKGPFINLGNVLYERGDFNTTVENHGLFTVAEGARLNALPDELNPQFFRNKPGATLRFLGGESSGMPDFWSVVNQGTIESVTGEIDIGVEVNQKAGGRILAEFDSTLTFSEDVEVSEPGVLVGGGKIVFSGESLAISEGAQLQNQMDAQSDGVLFTNGITLSGEGLYLSASGTLFENGTLDALDIKVLENQGSELIFQASEDNPEALRRINGILFNDWQVTQNSDINLGPLARIVNNRYYTFEDEVLIDTYFEPTAVIFENNTSGKLIKTGNGLAKIDIRLENKGDIEVRGGTLQFSAGGTLSSNHHTTNIKLTDGGILELNNTEAFTLGGNGGDPSDPTFRTIISGNPDEGTVVIDSDITIHARQSLVINSDAIWKSGTVTSRAFKDDLYNILYIGKDGGLGNLVITGNAPHIFDSLSLVYIGTSSSVIQDDNLTLDNIGMVIAGTYYLNAETIWTNEWWPYIFIRDGGTFVVRGNSSHEIKPEFAMDREGVGKIILEAGASLAMKLRAIDTVDFDNAGDLKRGHWVLEENSSIIANEGASIDTLKPDVIVELSKNSSFNNLPIVTGDFSIEEGSTLLLKNATFTIVGDTYVDGHLEGNNSTVVIDGTLVNGTGDGLLSATLNGNLTISTIGGIINNGWVIPGQSPGTITINGKYTQTETGVLEIEVGGMVPIDEHDQLIINGNATLGGTLLLSSLNNFDWTEEVSVPAVRATSFTGDFDQVIFGGESSRQIAELEIVGEELLVSSNIITADNFGDWRNAHFTEADLLDESISGPLADPDLDGTGNFLEYVFDYVPQFVDAQEPIFDIQLNETGDKLLVGVIFPWAKGMTDVQYTLQTSPDLETWTDLESTLANTEEGEFADRLTVEAEIDVVGNIPVYGRLLVKEIEL